MGMDVPVSLALLLAFSGSVWSIASDSGEIYFDSIAMFVFFLLGARLLECNARIRGARAMDQLASAAPDTACRFIDRRSRQNTEVIPTIELSAGDLIHDKTW